MCRGGVYNVLCVVYVVQYSLFGVVFTKYNIKCSVYVLNTNVHFQFTESSVLYFYTVNNCKHYCLKLDFIGY